MGMTRTPDEIKKGLECRLCDEPADLCGEDCPCWSAYSPREMYEDKDVADALALIQQLQDENAQLNRCIENMTDKLNAMNDEVAKVQAERDAAVAELVGTCQVCRWEETAKCASCHFCEDAWNVHESNWEWRGLQKGECDV